MLKEEKHITEKIKIKNMVCNSCVKVIRSSFEQNQIKVENIQLGSAEISYNPNKISEEKLAEILQSEGFDLIKSKDKFLVEEIKQAVIELIHYMNNVDSIVRKSEYLVEKLGHSYQHISKVFSKHEPITLEKYIIFQKIERIKALLDTDDYTLSEIAYMMDYSSVQHLSAQFKNITNYTVSEYKSLDINIRKSIAKII